MTFSMYRPESRLSNTVSGFVAGKSDPHGRFLGNVKARIVMALDNLQAAKKKNNISVMAEESHRHKLLNDILNGVVLDHDSLQFCGLIVEE